MRLFFLHLQKFIGMKVIKWILIIVGILGVIGYFGLQFAQSQTKKHSPEEVVKYERKGVEMSVFYCRPYKKGRTIFGELVPFNEVWRTGANEPTTFTTNTKITFAGEVLEPGTYSMWTIPQTTQWTIILNSEIPGWGANFDGKAAHNPKYDVLKVNTPVYDLTDEEEVEQLTIKLENYVNLTIAWDKTKVIVPITY